MPSRVTAFIRTTYAIPKQRAPALIHSFDGLLRRDSQCGVVSCCDVLAKLYATLFLWTNCMRAATMRSSPQNCGCVYCCLVNAHIFFSFFPFYTLCALRVMRGAHIIDSYIRTYTCTLTLYIYILLSFPKFISYHFDSPLYQIRYRLCTFLWDSSYILLYSALNFIT